jgi:hypothetical protein
LKEHPAGAANDLAGGGLVPKAETGTVQPDHGIQVYPQGDAAPFADRAALPLGLPHVGDGLAVVAAFDEGNAIGVRSAHGDDVNAKRTLESMLRGRLPLKPFVYELAEHGFR